MVGRCRANAGSPRPPPHLCSSGEACDVAWIRISAPNVRRSVIALNDPVQVCSAFLWCGRLKEMIDAC